MSRNVSVSLNAEQADWVDKVYAESGESVTRSQIVRDCVAYVMDVQTLRADSARPRHPVSPQVAMLVLEPLADGNPEAQAAVSLLWDYILLRSRRESSA